MKSVAILLFVCMLVSCTRQNSTKEEFEYINKSIEYLCDNIEDSVVIVTADHGHINTEYYFLQEYTQTPSGACRRLFLPAHSSPLTYPM